MSIESARAFAAKMQEDEVFRKSFIETGSKDKAMQLVKSPSYVYATRVRRTNVTNILCNVRFCH